METSTGRARSSGVPPPSRSLLPVPDMSHQALRHASRFLPAGILVVLACWQIFLAQTRGLTPWKGGGFGMFSTVDSPGSRFLRVYLLTPDGEVPVTIPGEHGRLAGRVRAMPSQEKLDELATRLAGEAWVPRAYNDLAATPECALPPVCHERRPGCSSPLPPLYRARREEEPEPSAGERVAVAAVRVELWKSRFDLERHRLVAARHLQAVAAGAAERQARR